MLDCDQSSVVLWDPLQGMTAPFLWRSVCDASVRFHIVSGLEQPVIPQSALASTSPLRDPLGEESSIARSDEQIAAVLGVVASCPRYRFVMGTSSALHSSR